MDPSKVYYKCFQDAKIWKCSLKDYNVPNFQYVSVPEYVSTAFHPIVLSFKLKGPVLILGDRQTSPLTCRATSPSPVE